MLQHTHSDHPTWTRPDHHSTRLPLATTPTDATRPPHLLASNPPALTTSLFVNKEPAPVLGSAVPATTREIREISPTDERVGQLPPAPPPYSSVPSSLQVGHPTALRPGRPEVKQVSNDELDRVVSMYYDRRPSDPVADKNWLWAREALLHRKRKNPYSTHSGIAKKALYILKTHHRKTWRTTFSLHWSVSFVCFVYFTKRHVILRSDRCGFLFASFSLSYDWKGPEWNWEEMDISPLALLGKLRTGW